jgi:uncharacterized protein (UPF0548 family)
VLLSSSALSLQTLAAPSPLTLSSLSLLHNRISRFNHAAPAGALTLPALPPGAGWFAVDRCAVRVGETAEDFRTAADAVAAWHHAAGMGWVAIDGPGSGRGGRAGRRPAPGDPVCIGARALGPGVPWAPWLANPLVVVGVREGGGGGGGGRGWWGRRSRWKTAAGVPAPPSTSTADDGDGDTLARYDLALATTAGHVLAGGERFSVTRRADGGGVWFEASAFARPATVAAAAGWPVVRALQAAFRRGAGERVRAAVEEAGGGGRGGRGHARLMW